MAIVNVRLASVVLDNFMNVVHGALVPNAAENMTEPSILGLFGQNGSGKTALIRTLVILKALLTEQPLKDEWCDYIHVEAETARLQFEFYLSDPDGTDNGVRVFYEVVLTRKKRAEPSGVLIGEKGKGEILSILSEKLWLALPVNKSGEKTWQSVLLMDTTAAGLPFGPEAVYRQLIGNTEDDRSDLMVAKKMAAEKRTSFVFTTALCKVLGTKSQAERTGGLNSVDLFLVLLSLQEYGLSELFVIESSESVLVNRNVLPMRLKVAASESHSELHGLVLLPLDESFTAMPPLMTVIQEIIGQLNIVLTQLVPGLTIELKTLGSELGENGETLERAQLVSLKNRRAIPLKYESDGIKKIIAVLHLLICVYNQRSVTVAIDELDSGVFEYLLGELLKILSEGGKGQLIFTSHNLRALETLDPACVAFTTADPTNRYAGYQEDGEIVNLRDVYYRNLVLGADEAQKLYNPTDNGRIAFAMRKAGISHG